MRATKTAKVTAKVCDIKPSAMVGPNGETHELVDLTPKMASEFLTHMPPEVNYGHGNFQQRRLRESTVLKYVRLMKDGQWIYNGQQSIIFDQNGFLRDGQHRCWAVVKSGLKMRIMVVRNVCETAIDTLDQGAKRTPSDVLTMAGITPKIAGIVSTAATMSLNLERNNNPLYRDPARLPTPHEVLEFIEQHPDFLVCCAKAAAWYHQGCPVQAALGAFLLYRAQLQDPDQAYEFVEKLMTGAGLESDDPRLWIRNKFVRDMGSSRRIRPQIKLALIVKTWNRYLSQATPKIEHNFFRVDPEAEFARLMQGLN